MSGFFFRILVLAVLVVSGTGAWLIFSARSLPDVSFLRDPGVSFTIQVPDWQDRLHPFVAGPENPDWMPLETIPGHLRHAVLAGEDFSFYAHDGVDWYEVYESLKRNLKERRFARGASTITQQLAKNLFLSREKSLRRKLREVILARRMEKALSKDRILELYLNIVEVGDMVYGVGAGADHHFGKQPSQLTVREASMLAAMLPGPRLYNPEQNLDRVINRSDHILGVMLKGGWIEEKEYLAALNELPSAAAQQAEDSTWSEHVSDSSSHAGSGADADAGETAASPEEEPPSELNIPAWNEGIVEIPIK